MVRFHCELEEVAFRGEDGARGDALRARLAEGLRTRRAPKPEYDRRLCMDLLQAKLAAMDAGRGFPIQREVMCERCRLVFAELDLGQEACAGLDERMPAESRRRIERALREAAAASKAR